MKYETSQNLSREEFKRLFGVKRETFAQMMELMKQSAKSKGKGGVKAKLSLEDQILVTLQYWREYRTYFHIANDWEVSESTICRAVKKVENVLIKSEKFRLAGKKSLWQEQHPALIAIDVTETKVERPKHHQKRFYSGKKKHHALKAQLVVDLTNLKIICTAYGNGHQHDFSLFKASGVRFHSQTQGLADKGYQGLQNLHPNSLIPIKKPKNGSLSKDDKRFNRQLARQRIAIEHVNRRLKIFKILSLPYRNRRRRFGLRCNLIAAIYNFEVSLPASKNCSPLS
ncbi:IS5 family transposase [Pseudanabaena sp. ABRG5-3]|uniref:IS5 family transposase n=1 Tax=Pseudanabaena sp. ABRG5-3 TaxID=685565 RepID=UPI000DC70203|nr:IS5 family transposase [Pseudanabaena sp. ABRG5-3]BBC22944.1 transposase, IS4 family protein [Pseudanabaena sp. ABRG5-3]BBC22957.1 transposase, IS4 family protein [Pseudanabaena sp. ABRG5-3]BBC24849.1 transposase, IS4 family protein [Pseudanabaena sp. ABRG5-3]BBC25825.1 transposase, IS4 family protein [Pseudanabaena sp. ABRG5-3]BBC26613.1 transposase, IS4 family protein [Pseudanabaena sp. ABRG5-3]